MSEVLSTTDASYGGDEEEALPPLSPPLEPEDVVVVVPPTTTTTEKSTAELIREVADNVQSCRVCYDEYHAPDNQARLLACGHSFCSRCLTVCGSPAMHTRDNPHGIKCPECRKISRQAPASLPVNFQLMQILTVLSLVREKPPEGKQNEPQLPNFDRLGQLLPADDFSELNMDELFEHVKVVFNAMRLKAEGYMDEVENMCDFAQMEMNVHLRRLSEIEMSVDRFVKGTKLVRTGHSRRPNLYMRRAREQHGLNDADWMREMVVYGLHDAVPIPGIDFPGAPDPYFPHLNYPFADAPIEAILEREQAAGEEADPRRNLDNMRDALFRRERRLAQQREADIANGQLVQRLLENNRGVRDNLPQQPVVEEEDEDEDTSEEGSETDSDESSFLDEEEDEEEEQEPLVHPLLAPEEVQEQLEFQQSQELQTMTIGELVSIYRILNRLIAPDTMETVRDITSSQTDPKTPVTEHQKSELEVFGRDHNVNVNEVLFLLREHCIKNAETPRRRQRPAPLDENNALMSVIRRRARRALRGERPTQPTSDEQADLTMRLIVNMATSLGVRERLENLLCPHREPHMDEQVFVQRTNPSTRQVMLFCTVCRCNVPHGSQQSHLQGRRHIANQSSHSRQN